MTRSGGTILRARGLGKRFDGLVAVADLDFDVQRGEIFAIIGPNGAGKTTTLNMVSGLLSATTGELMFGNVDITTMATADRTRLGLGRAFQVVQPFPEMTVRENVMVGALFGRSGVSRREAERRADAALDRSGLTRFRDTAAEDLTLMQEKRLEIARALATSPDVLLLDEVMAGLRPKEAQQAVELIRDVREHGVTIVFIEHVMPVVRDLADRVMVMDYGKKIAQGTYHEVTSNPEVIEAYLGREDHEKEHGAKGDGAEGNDEEGNGAEGVPA